MALVLNDRVKETSTSTGTGAMTLAGAAIGFITFATGIQGNNTTYYTIHNQGTNEWEVGLGTLNAAGNELTRTTVITSSGGGTAVTFNTGTKDVFCTLPAVKTTDMTLTATGDVLYASAANTPARLALGSAGQILVVNAGATAPEWTVNDKASEGFAVAMAIAL
jgi:hypothetical protein|tara:strand:- start:1123 stop:1614 length:492 start_codon:yes stop_codon:yes gene_type:complete